MKLKLQFIKKIESGRKTKDYIKTMLLVDSNSWGSPWASVDELQLILRQNPDWSEKAMKTEMAFTHKQEVENGSVIDYLLSLFLLLLLLLALS